MRPTLFTVIVTLSAASCAFAQETAPVTHPFLCCDNGQGKVFIITAAGEIAWQLDVPISQDVWRLPNGNFLLSNVRGAQEVSVDKRVVWEYKSPDGTEVHSCQPLPDGKVLIGECGTKRIIEVDREGKITKEIHVETTTENVHLHYSICRKLETGNYLVACVGEHMLKELDGDGNVVRAIPTPGDVFVGVRLPNGNTLIGCGDGHKIVEVDPKGLVEWQVDENELPGIPLRFVAGLQRLPNGNTVVCNWGGHGHVGEQPLIFEITRDKQVVWKVDDYEHLRTISNVQLLDVPGDVTQGEALR